MRPGLALHSDPYAGTACDELCPDGRACILDGNIRHELHICGYVPCYCHAESRYRADGLPPITRRTTDMRGKPRPKANHNGGT